MTERNHAEIAHGYAVDVISGAIPACKFVKHACERYLRDLERAGTEAFPYVYDIQRGSKVCRFVELLPHIKGPKASEPLIMAPWQVFCTMQVFAWLHDRGANEGKRRFRRVYIEVPRGNGKSAWAAGISMFCLAADGEGGAEVYSAARTRDQAKIAFWSAQQMARKSPDLMRHLGVEVLAHRIIQNRTASYFEAVSADADSLDGKNVHFGLIDELHAHRSREVFDAIKTGAGKRPQSLMWSITTAGSNRAGIAFEVRGYTIKILNRTVTDESTFGIVYTIDDGDDWTKEETWRKANPNYGISVQPEVIAQLCAKAMQMPAAQNSFLTKHLDIWVSADVSWMDMRIWEKCGDPTLDLADFEGEKCWIGLDLASKSDIAALMRVFRREIDGEVHWYCFGTYFLPQSAIDESRNSQYAGWEVEGRLIVTPGNALDFSCVQDMIMDDSSRFEVTDIGYDPWQAQHLAQKLMADGARVTEFRNNTANFSFPMKEIEALARTGRLHHDGDPVLSWMISNVVCHLDNKDNVYPRKERPENKIDGVVALITALGRALAAEQAGDLDGYLGNMIMVGVD